MTSVQHLGDVDACEHLAAVQEARWYRHDPYDQYNALQYSPVADEDAFRMQYLPQPESSASSDGQPVVHAPSRDSSRVTLSSDSTSCSSSDITGANSVRRTSWGLPSPASESDPVMLSCSSPVEGSSVCSGSRREIVSQGDEVVVVVQFKWGRLGRFSCNQPLAVGKTVVVEVERGTDLGVIQGIDHLGSRAERRIIRAATRKEQNKWRKQLVLREQAAKTQAQQVLDEAGLTLQVRHAEYQFDMKRLTFHYTSDENRPNFRTVLDDLFALFRCRIWFARYTGEQGVLA